METRYTAEQLNALFMAKAKNPQEREKLASYAGGYIKDRLREAAFVRAFLPPRQAKRSELQISMTHDTFVKIVYIEPTTRAMTMGFNGQPNAVIMRAERMEVPFFQIGSERYEKTEQEVDMYDIPITAIFKNLLVRDIAEIEDLVFVRHLETSTQILQKDHNGVALTSGFSDTTAFTAYNVKAKTAKSLGKVKSLDAVAQTSAASASAGVTEDLNPTLQKDDLIALFKLFSGRGGRGSRLECAQFLISSTDHEDLASWSISDVGDKVVGETAMMGWKSKELIGRRYVRTIKTDILRPGNIYASCAPEFVGEMLLWNNVKFYQDTERNRFSMEAWEDIAMYIANVASVRKLELYAGSSDLMASGATSNAAIREDFAPMSEADLGAQNNLVAKGGTSPVVRNF